MPNRLKMSKVKTILTLREQGWSFVRIARELGIHRETVARYVRLIQNRQKGSRSPRPAIASGVVIVTLCMT